jgi:ABC-type lipoprotein export system ATPase subunit
MISLRDVRFSRDTGFALSIPLLEIAAGEKLAIVGPSGTGKTTLLALLSGIITPQAGQIAVGGLEVSRLPDHQRRAFRARYVGAVFQDFELVEYLSARENILYPARISDSVSLTPALRARADALAKDVGLSDRLSRKPAALSQGEQQRVALCRALLNDPPLILADEPTGNLDPANKDRILDILFQQADRSGATLITVTHDHALLPRFDRVIDFADFQREVA